ncbi:MAG: hypothetical protein ACN6QU_23020, partial [Paraburkholderia terricola]
AAAPLPPRCHLSRNAVILTDCAAGWILRGLRRNFNGRLHREAAGPKFQRKPRRTGRAASL